MEIVIQSALEKNKPSDLAVHVRYWHWKGKSRGYSIDGENSKADQEGSNHSKIKSYVIIRRQYSYLEPMIRAMFSDAEDVIVMVDRRLTDRSEIAEGNLTEYGPGLTDRRRSSPMLDILIKIEE